jgi:large subunit ribosomal protein L17
MRHRSTKKVLDRKAPARSTLYINIASGLFLSGHIVTTKARATAIRPFIERLITYARTPSLAHTRYLQSALRNHTAVIHKLTKTIGPKYKDRKGGYVRIVKMGLRKGDSAEIAKMELV